MMWRQQLRQYQWPFVTILSQFCTPPVYTTQLLKPDINITLPTPSVSCTLVFKILPHRNFACITCLTHRNQYSLHVNYPYVFVAVPDLRRGFAAARLLRLRVRIPPRAWMSVLCYTSSGRRLCDGLITRPDGVYRVWRVWVWCQNLNNGALAY